MIIIIGTLCKGRRSFVVKDNRFSGQWGMWPGLTPVWTV